MYNLIRWKLQGIIFEKYAPFFFQQSSTIKKNISNILEMSHNVYNKNFS